MWLVNKNTLSKFGIILLIMLSQSISWAEGSAPEQSKLVGSALAVSETDRPSVDPGTTGHIAQGSNKANQANSATIEEKKFGDGRAGFWIIGILVNLTVLTLFLVWAKKEWRKKKGD